MESEKRNHIKTVPRVSIIILNWNGWMDTVECLESVYRISYPSYDIIVADNGSENESLDKIKDYAEGKIKVTSNFFNYSDENKPLRYIRYSREEAEAGGGREEEIANLPSWKRLILIENGKNFGFAEGNNIAIRYVMKALSPEYVLLLNNDTVVDRAFLDELITVAESDNKIGFVGPKTYYYDYYGRTNVINFAGGRLVMWKGKSFHIGLNKTDQGQFDKTIEIDFVEGSCLLARKETLKAIGLLDPAYFLYWEETDWCMRARNAGFHLFYSSKSKIWHKIGASTRGNNLFYYLIRNRFLFMKKYATWIQYISFFCFFFGYELWLLSMISLLYHRNFKEWVLFLKGIKEGIIFKKNKVE
jgi:GT2 family glycosyltransferase